VQQKSDLHEDLLLFYINAPSIIIGRHQNTLEEINREYVEEHGIRVVRRLSGGGAVYHDLGNLNFSFITDYRPEDFQNFKKFTEPVVRALQNLGVPAVLTGRNDIEIDEHKVSGNAQYISRGRIVSHGTLLFNSDLSHVSEALNVHETKMASKGIKSVRSRVANISDYLKEPMDIETFKLHVLHTYFEGRTEIQRLPLNDADWEAVLKLAEERYRSWDWTYGRSPDFNVERRQRFPGGEIDARLDVAKGIIQSAKFYGDYFSELDPTDVEKLLVGVKYEFAAIRDGLKGIEISRYFPGQDAASFAEFLI
ncbi:MAG TPA: lipoate--protein ligase, partial [Anaerolineaceae bacterium]|nr:lipoate--protein ligase [Anaerolineaceae bacterium]